MALILLELACFWYKVRKPLFGWLVDLELKSLKFIPCVVNANLRSLRMIKWIPRFVLIDEEEKEETV